MMELFVLFFFVFMLAGMVFLLRGMMGVFFAPSQETEVQERLKRMEGRLEQLSHDVEELRDQVATLLIEMDDEMAFRRLEQEMDAEEQERLRRRIQEARRRSP